MSEATDKALVEAVKLGQTVENEFYGGSETLELVVQAAIDEADEAKKQLVVVDPTDTKKIVELQMTARMDIFLATFIEKTITRGREAADAIRSDDEAAVQTAQGEEIEA